jgi:biotin operon repressor
LEKQMTSPTAADMAENALLATLRQEDQQKLAPHMMKLELRKNDSLQKAGEEVLDTWFPCGAATASFCVWADDSSPAVEVGMVGREGAVGGIVSNGRVPAFSSSVVIAGGTFLRIKISALEHAKLESIALRHWFARYSDCLLAQVFQTAACNATHTIMQRTAKWLLAAMERTRGTDIDITQEQLAEMLGVGRSFVTRVVSHLRDEGIVTTRRGGFRVEKEAALRKKSCRCTEAIENHFDRVLHGIYPRE